MHAFDMKKEIEQVSHSDVARYLKSHQWKKTPDGEDGLLDCYEKDNAIIDLLVDESLPSYQDRLRHTVLSLAHYEERNKEDLFSDIINSRTFTFRVKAKTSQHKIRLDDSISLRQSVKKVFLASAHSTLLPVINIERMNKKDPVSIADNLYDDQTEAASYIANFRVPITTYDELSSEMVLDTLISGLKTTKETIEEDTLPGKTQYDDLSKRGISKQFLENLKGFELKNSNASQTEIEIIKAANPSPIKFCFEKQDFEFISDFCEFLSKESEESDTEIEGIITGVDSPDTEVGGTAKLRTTIEGELKTVKIKLEKDSYDRVAGFYGKLRSASTKPDNVKFKGLLRKRSRAIEMVDVSKVTLPDLS